MKQLSVIIMYYPILLDSHSQHGNIHQAMVVDQGFPKLCCVMRQFLRRLDHNRPSLICRTRCAVYTRSSLVGQQFRFLPKPSAAAARFHPVASSSWFLPCFHSPHHSKNVRAFIQRSCGLSLAPTTVARETAQQRK